MIETNGKNIQYKIVPAALWIILILMPGCTGKDEKMIVSHDFTKKELRKNYRILDHFNFDQCASYLGRGWSRPSKDSKGEYFVCSQENIASLLLYVAQRKMLNVSMQYTLFNPRNKEGKIKIAINQKHITTLNVKPGTGEQMETFSFSIPGEHLALGTNMLQFNFDVKTPGKPVKKFRSQGNISINLYDMNFSNNPGKNEDFPDCNGNNLVNVAYISRITINNDMKIGILQHPNTSIVFKKCFIPADSYLKFYLGFHPEVKERNIEVTFLAFVNEEIPDRLDKGSIIFSRTVTLNNAKDEPWREFKVDLAGFAGKIVSFSFNVLADVDPQRIITVWGEPKIYSKMTEPAYNVVLITMDSLRPDHVGCYGNGNKITPNIDSFSKDAVIYTECYSPVSWTLPSISSFYTSLYPPAHGAKCEKKQSGDIENIGPKKILAKIPTFLEPYRYLTQVTTWHPFFETNYGLTDEFRFFDRNSDSYHIPPFYNENINRWIKWLAAEKFFLHIHIMPPHSPFSAASPYYEKLIDFNNPLLKNGDLKLFYSPFTNDLEKWGKGSKDPDAENLILNLYDNSLALADEFFGKILLQLKESGLYNDSLIIFSSDHGEQFGEHGKVGHSNSLYREELHVPLLIKFPKRFNIRGKRIDSLVSTLDILPTILEVNNITIPGFFHGQKLFNLKDRSLEKNTREYLYLFHDWPDSVSRGVIWRDYHYIYSTEKGTGTHELYKMSDDPYEKKNLAPQEREIMKKLSGLLNDYDKTVGAGAGSEGISKKRRKKNAAEENDNKLKTLGYL